MSKIENKIKKNMDKVKTNKRCENPVKNQILYFAKIICGISVVAIVICVISNIASGNYKLEEDVQENDYSNILAGQVFTRSEEEYYVVFYENDDILEKINKITSKSIYKVDLNSLLNKNIISETGNSKANDAESLKINGTTIIKIVSGKNESYIEGYDKVVEYLNNL